MKKKSAGFSFVAILAIILSLLVVIGVGYIAYDRFFREYLDGSSEIVDGPQPDTITADDLPEAPIEITNQSDLDSAIETLDSVDLDASQLDEIENELNSF
jgi:hypothetical protein